MFFRTQEKFDTSDKFLPQGLSSFVGSNVHMHWGYLIPASATTIPFLNNPFVNPTNSTVSAYTKAILNHARLNTSEYPLSWYQEFISATGRRLVAGKTSSSEIQAALQTLLSKVYIPVNSDSNRSLYEFNGIISRAIDKKDYLYEEAKNIAIGRGGVYATSCLNEDNISTVGIVGAGQVGNAFSSLAIAVAFADGTIRFYNPHYEQLPTNSAGIGTPDSTDLVFNVGAGIQGVDGPNAGGFGSTLLVGFPSSQQLLLVQETLVGVNPPGFIRNRLVVDTQYANNMPLIGIVGFTPDVFMNTTAGSSIASSQGTATLVGGLSLITTPTGRISWYTYFPHSVLGVARGHWAPNPTSVGAQATIAYNAVGTGSNDKKGCRVIFKDPSSSSSVTSILPIQNATWSMTFGYGVEVDQNPPIVPFIGPAGSSVLVGLVPGLRQTFLDFLRNNTSAFTDPYAGGVTFSFPSYTGNTGTINPVITTVVSRGNPSIFTVVEAHRSFSTGAGSTPIASTFSEAIITAARIPLFSGDQENFGAISGSGILGFSPGLSATRTAFIFDTSFIGASGAKLIAARFIGGTLSEASLSETLGTSPATITYVPTKLLLHKFDPVVSGTITVDDVNNIGTQIGEYTIPYATTNPTSTTASPKPPAIPGFTEAVGAAAGLVFDVPLSEININGFSAFRLFSEYELSDACISQTITPAVPPFTVTTPNTVVNRNVVVISPRLGVRLELILASESDISSSTPRPNDLPAEGTFRIEERLFAGYYLDKQQEFIIPDEIQNIKQLGPMNMSVNSPAYTNNQKVRRNGIEFPRFTRCSQTVASTTNGATYASSTNTKFLKSKSSIQLGEFFTSKTDTTLTTGTKRLLLNFDRLSYWFHSMDLLRGKCKLQFHVQTQTFNITKQNSDGSTSIEVISSPPRFVMLKEKTETLSFNSGVVLGGVVINTGLDTDGDGIITEDQLGRNYIVEFDVTELMLTLRKTTSSTWQFILRNENELVLRNFISAMSLTEQNKVIAGEISNTIEMYDELAPRLYFTDINGNVIVKNGYQGLTLPNLTATIIAS